MRLQEIHPAIVHFPIALYPTALCADWIGKLTSNEGLADVGRWGVAFSAGAAVPAALTGAVAQETTQLDGDAHDLLVAHRNLNVGFLGLATALAIHRSGRSSPGAGYLAIGTAGLGALMYSAYLGGHMVYEHGAAVKPAGKLREDKAPEVRPGYAGRLLHATVSNLLDGVRHTAESLLQEPLLPNWTKQWDTEIQAESEAS